MSAPVYSVSRYFLSSPARLDIGPVLPLLQIEMLRICLPAALSMQELRQELIDGRISTEDQAHAMAWTVYLSLRGSRAGHLMDDTFLDRNKVGQPVRYYVTRAGHAYLQEQERSAA